MRIVNAHRKPYFSKELAKIQADLLETAERLFKDSGTLDTAVRDTLADGLARLVYVAYDCAAANGARIDGAADDDDGFDAYREWSTEKWFRDRGFADWYAKGAASLFHAMRLPSFRLIQVTHRKPKKKAVA